MEFHALTGLIEAQQSDTLVVSLFQGEDKLDQTVKRIDELLSGAISEMIASSDITGKLGEVSQLYPRGVLIPRRVLVVGLGKKAEFGAEVVRKSASAALKRARDLNARNVAFGCSEQGIAILGLREYIQAAVEGIRLGQYRFQMFHTVDDSEKDIERVLFTAEDQPSLQDLETGITIADAVSDGVCLARDLVNMPANYATPLRIAEAARSIADTLSLSIMVGDREWAAQQKMGAFLGVSQGAKEPAQFIVLEYNGAQADLETVVLVGKGITFDSGGISIKPSEKMEDMKSDMGGAAAVLGTMKAVAELKLPLHVVGIMPCTDNMPDGGAFHPGDILTASNGKTIEIISTDAEGRLILSDALVYAQRYSPKYVVDLATLTGACVIALGDGVAAGLFSNDQALSDKLVASGQATHERLWPMPLWDDYRLAIKSNVADMKNTGGRYGGVGTSAIFLKEFINYSWAHLDIAGMALSAKENGYIPAGGTGYGVRLLTDFLLKL
jgi:leucyl aminopeptidase